MVSIESAAAQQSSSSTSASVTTSAEQSAEGDATIVVNGVRYPVKVSTHAYDSDLQAPIRAADNAQMFGHCVKLSTNTRALHNLIDGLPHREVRSTAYRQIVTAYRACPGVTTPISYGRGALIERVLSTYAANLDFTSDQLLQPEIIARYRAREERFDKTRPNWESMYAKFAGCLVASRPELALAYPKTEPNSLAETRVREALVGSSPECARGAKSLTINVPLFRSFLDDAIYSWATALRGTDTLIPVSA